FLSLLSLSFRAIWVLRPFAFQVTARPLQAEPISAMGTIGSASVSPSQPDQPPPRGRPELAGKSCFPTEVRPKLPKLPARNSPSFLHQIDRFIDLLFMDNQASEVQSTCRRNLRRVKLARTICHRNTLDPPPGHSKLPHRHVRGDSAEISAEV
ncbi:hypothetical protein Prudu_013082, partial [Prunus dulcis]